MDFNEEARSEAFRTFWKQLNSRGYERAQGLDPSIMQQLKGEEAIKAKTELIAAFHRGDPTVLSALVTLLGTDAIPILEGKLETLSQPGLLHSQIAAYLWKLTGDECYRDHLIANLSIDDELQRVSILHNLIRMGKSEKSKSVFLEILKTDPSRKVRATAARGVLFMINRISSPEAWDYPDRPLVMKIVSGDKGAAEISIKKILSIVELS